MAFSVARSFMSVSLRLSRNIRHGFGAGAAMSSPYGQMERGLTRSMWYWSSQSKPLSHRSDGIKAIPYTEMCGCCGLHTAGDKEMADFLKQEIEMERKSAIPANKLPQISGFDITKTDGAEVTLSRKTDNETVKVTFNVNDSVEDDEAEGFDETQPPQDPQESQAMVSRPQFTVEINKGGDMSLALHCMLPAPEADEMSQEEVYDDLIQITEIALLNKSEWKDSTYTMSGSIMDGNLYDMLLKMLEERGINADFVQELIDFSTAFEQNKYIGLLEELKEFISCAK